MELNQRAQELYEKTKSILVDGGLWEPEDHTLCETFAFYKEKWETLANELGNDFIKKGDRVKDSVIKHPGWALLKEFKISYMEALNGLGLGVAQRKKLKIDKLKEIENDPTNPLGI